MNEIGEHICDVCGRGYPYFERLEQHVKRDHSNPRGKVNRMGKTIGQMKKERGLGGPPMLHGSDLPAKVKQVRVTCKELREPPSQFKSLAIFDLAKPVYDKESWAVNGTNLAILSTKAGLGDDLNAVDFDDIANYCKGKQFILQVVMVNDPSKNKMVPSLQIV